jgi:hypothetical protein
VENWNTNGESCVWVQVPQLTSNSYVWASWGNSAEVAPAPACWINSATWSSAYRAVWHMKEGAGSTLRDSTANANHGVLSPGTAWTEGQAGEALQFNGITTDYVGAGTTPSLSLTNGFSLSAWIRPDAFAATNFYGLSNGFLSRGPSSAATLNYALEIKNSTTVTFVKRTFPENLKFYDFTVPVLTNDWALVTLSVVDGTAALSVNGISCGSKAVGVIAPASGDVMYLGCIMPSKQTTAFVGGLDEVRICDVARSSGWVWADWMNMASNRMFSSLGEVSVSLIITDANINGLPDLWERQYFGSTNAVNGGAQDDWDSDGMDNLSEYVAGTCPTNASSLLRIDEVAMDRTAGHLTLRWPSVAGRLYSVRTSTNLLVGFDGLEADCIEATPAFNTHTASVDQIRSRYYRVTVEQEPPIEFLHK